MSNLPGFIYLLLLAPLAVAYWAQSRVRDTYAEEGRVENHLGYTGMEAARLLLSEEHLQQVQVEVIPGRLTDHYDPLRKVLRLSAETARQDTIASLGIVGHEIGHALQDIRGYGLMRVRRALAEWLLALSRVSVFVFIGGFLFGITVLMVAALIIVALQAVFSLVAFPVERNASRRALELLEKAGLITTEEKRQVRRVLSAASYTYVALVTQRVAGFFFWILLVAFLTRTWQNY